MTAIAQPPARPPKCPHTAQRLPQSASAVCATSPSCKQPSSLMTSVTQGILCWSVIIATTALLLCAPVALRKTPAPAPATVPAASFVPITALQQLPANLPLMQLLLCLPGCLTLLIVAAALSTSTFLAPSWYSQGGREQLLAAARLLPKAVTLLQLLLLPAHPQDNLQSMWLRTFTAGMKGLPAVMIWPLLFRTTVRSYIHLVPLECALYMAVSCLFTFRTSSPHACPPLAAIVALVLLYAVCGLAFPITLLTCSKHLLGNRPQLAPQATGSWKPRTSPTCDTSSEVPRYSIHANTNAAPTPHTPSPSKGLPALSASPVSRPLAGLAAVGATATVSAKTTGGGRTTHAKSSLYRRRSTVKLLSIKIHDHRAYPRREAILASLTAALESPQTTSPPMLLSSCAVEGCLQLLISATTLSDSDHLPPPFAGDPCELFAQLHSQLPASCRNGLVTFHMNDTFQAFGGSSGQQLPLELLQLPSSGGGNRLQWAPVCFEAGSQEEAEVELTCGMVAGGVEAVVFCMRQGVEVVEKLPLQLVDSSVESCGRLLLPPGLDVGPVSIYLLSTQEGMRGVLLGSATTMALPPPAAAELQDAYSYVFDEDASAQAEYQATITGLLRDFATCWQLPGSCDEVPQAAAGSEAHGRLPEAEVAQMAAELLHYLSCEGLPVCCSLLSARCIAAGASTVTSAESADSAAAGYLAAAPMPPPPRAAAVALARAIACPADASASLTTPAAAALVSDRLMQVRQALQRRLATSLCLPVQRLAAHWAHLRAVSSGPGFTSWKLQQARWVYNTGWILITTMSVLSICLSGKRLLGALGFGMPWVLSMAFLLLQSVPAVVAHVLLAVAGERVRRRREAVVLVFAAVKAAGCMVGVWGWLQIPATFRAIWGVLRTALVLHGLLRPCLLQVSWRVQLLVSSIEEAGRYAALTAPPYEGGGAGGPERAQLPSWQYARLSLTVVAAAVASSSLMEVLYLSVYSRHVAASRYSKQAAVLKQHQNDA